MTRKIKYQVAEIEPGTVLYVVYEIEDALFHHNSSLILPSKPEGKTSKNGAAPKPEVLKVTGISAIADILKFIEKMEKRKVPKKILITGHTDTSGEIKYNFNLSKLRASNVISLLEGNHSRARKLWIDSIKYQTEDIKQILKHYSLYVGDIDNKLDEDTKTALKNFQKMMSIKQTGKVDEDTLLAIYDCYDKEISDALMIDIKELANYRNKIKYISNKYRILACGESRPKDEKYKDEYRSQTNRRVEIYIFDKDFKPVFNCPDPSASYDKKCDLADCPFESWKFLKKRYQKPVISPPAFNEKWRVQLRGWNLEIFGAQLNFKGGLKIHWVTDIDIFISGGRLIEAIGNFYLNGFENYSQPKNLYKCYCVKRRHLNMKMQDGSYLDTYTPYVYNEVFEIPGRVSGSDLILHFDSVPTDDQPYYYVDIHCDLNKSESKKYPNENFWESNEWTYAREPLTDTTQTFQIPLVDGTKIEEPIKNTVSLDWEATIQKISS